jgi:hypothetical protein
MRSTILSLSFCGNNDWRRGGGQGLRATAGGEQCDGTEGTVDLVPPRAPKGLQRDLKFEAAKKGRFTNKKGISLKCGFHPSSKRTNEQN